MVLPPVFSIIAQLRMVTQPDSIFSSSSVLRYSVWWNKEMVSNFHDSVHQRDDVDDMGFECSVDLHKSYELGSITDNVANATKIPHKERLHGIILPYVDANPFVLKSIL
jgi:hypothetical protein